MNHFAIFTLPSETYSSVELNGRSCDKKNKKKPKWGNADSTETDCTVAQLGFTTGADKRFFNFFIRAEICLHVVMYLHVC